MKNNSFKIQDRKPDLFFALCFCGFEAGSFVQQYSLNIFVHSFGLRCFLHFQFYDGQC